MEVRERKLADSISGAKGEYYNIFANLTLVQQNASFQLHNKQDQMSWAIMNSKNKINMFYHLKQLHFYAFLTEHTLITIFHGLNAIYFKSLLTYIQQWTVLYFFYNMEQGITLLDQLTRSSIFVTTNSTRGKIM